MVAGGSPPPLATVEVVKNLGVKFDSSLSFRPSALTVAGTCFGIIKSPRKFFDFLPLAARKTVAYALIASRLDHCNGLYVGTSKQTIQRLEFVQHAAARLFLKLPRHSSASAALRTLH